MNKIESIYSIKPFITCKDVAVPGPDAAPELNPAQSNLLPLNRLNGFRFLKITRG